MILHARKFADDDSGAVVTIGSPSGDTDIVIIMIDLLHKYRELVILYHFHSNNKKVYKLSNVEPDHDDVVDFLIMFQAFVGVDFSSSFFRKGKSTRFDLLSNSLRFKAAFMAPV